MSSGMSPDPQPAPSHPAGPRGVFFDEGQARAAWARLKGQGWEADLVRDRFHGEDDDEDQPWILTTDAPEVVLELAVEEHDGWLDAGAAPASPPLNLPPLNLPTEPKRIKRPPV